MPDVFIYEMFCDRVAASKIYNKSSYSDVMPLEYFLKAKGRRIIEQETSDKLEMLLRMLAEKGEEETFRYIKNERRKSKNNSEIFSKNA